MHSGKVDFLQESIPQPRIIRMVGNSIVFQLVWIQFLQQKYVQKLWIPSESLQTRLQHVAEYTPSSSQLVDPITASLTKYLVLSLLL